MHTVVRVRTTTYIHVKYNSNNTHVHVALQFRDGTLVHSTHIHTMYYAYHGVPLLLNYNNPFVDTVLDTLHFTLFFPFVVRVHVVHWLFNRVTNFSMS